jgi:L-glyceraldehyde 3-phosphate reductase
MSIKEVAMKAEGTMTGHDETLPMVYRRCGRSGLQLPLISLGLWHNFGAKDDFERARRMVVTAFELGITHMDLADNYGPPPGGAEEILGRILKTELARHRDELVLSTKAGHLMWDGPYGDWGSRKHLMAGIDQSLRRLGLDYVDIFYHHRPDQETPLEETMQALADIVRQGKALYVGISKYPPELACRAVALLREMNTPCLIHQLRYSMLDRQPELELLSAMKEKGVGVIAFSALAKGILAGRYLDGIPLDSRAAGASPFLNESDITPSLLRRVQALNLIAQERHQTLAQMALAWVLRDPAVTSVIIGASRPGQIIENAGAIRNLSFSDDEQKLIESALSG